MSCPRQWWLRYYRGLERKSSLEVEGVSKAEQGTSYHTYMQLHYSGVDVRPLLKEEPDDLVKRMVEGYLEWLAETGADQGLVIVTNERQIEIGFGKILGDDVVITGKLDLEVVDEWGLPKIMDHKTVASLGQADQLYLDFQGRTYSLLRRMEGNPVRGFVHNQAKRVKRTGSAEPPFYSRVEVSYNDTLLANHERQLRGTLERMVQASQRLESSIVIPDEHHAFLPPNPTKDCSWQCPFVGICGLFDDGSDAEGVLVDLFQKAGILDEQEEGGTE